MRSTLRQASLSQRILTPFAGRGQAFWPTSGRRDFSTAISVQPPPTNFMREHARNRLAGREARPTKGAGAPLCPVRVALRSYPAQVERQFRHGALPLQLFLDIGVHAVGFLDVRHLSADHLDLRRIELA